MMTTKVRFAGLALILAFAMALVQGIWPLLGAHRNHARWMALARPAQVEAHLVFQPVAAQDSFHQRSTKAFSIT